MQKRVLFVGEEAVGKSSFCNAIQDLPFLNDHFPTIEDVYELSDYTLVDTAGSSAFDRLRPSGYTGASLIVYCFALNDISTLISIEEKWIPELQYYTQAPGFLLGLKSDLKQNDFQSEIDLICKKLNCKYFEASASDPQLCKSILKEMIQLSMEPKAIVEPVKESIDLPTHSRMASTVPTKLVPAKSQDTLTQSDDGNSLQDRQSTLVMEKVDEIVIDEWKEPKNYRRNTMNAAVMTTSSSCQTAFPETELEPRIVRASTALPKEPTREPPRPIRPQKELPTVRIQPLSLPKKDVLSSTPVSADKTRLRKHASEMDFRYFEPTLEPMDTKKKKSGWSRLFKKKDKIMGVSSGYSNQGYASYTPPTMQSQPISSQRQSHRFSQPASSDTSFMNLNDSRPSRFSTQTTVPKKKGLLNRLFG